MRHGPGTTLGASGCSMIPEWRGFTADLEATAFFDLPPD